MSTKSIGLILLVGGILAVPVIAAWVYPHPVSEVATPDAKAVPVVQSSSESSPAVAADNEPDEPDPTDVEPSCIWGASKNLCDGRLRDGEWVVTQCGECINLVGEGAILRVDVYHNVEPCCDDATVPCDDTESLVGELFIKGEYHIRLNGPCPVRGWWQGSWDWYNGTIWPIATGWLDGTLGTGTHRVPICPTGYPGQRCGDKCETCYMAEFDEEEGRWIIHVEGSMVGEVANIEEYAGCMVRVMIQGFFVAPSTADGTPIPPNEVEDGWTFCGTMDGVLDCPCED